MEPDEVDPGMSERLLHGRPGLAVLDREAELGIELAGRDEVVSIRLDAGRDAQLGLDLAALRHRSQEELEFIGAVDHDRAARPHRQCQLLGGFVVAEEVNSVGREAGPHGQVELTGGDDVEAEALLGDNPEEGGAGEGLGRVEHLARPVHRTDELGRPLPYGVFVIDVERGAELPGEVDEVAPPDLHVAARVHPIGDREEHSGLGTFSPGSVRGAGAAAAAGAAAPAAAQAYRLLAGLRRAESGEGRDHDLGPGRFAARADLFPIPVGVGGQDVELGRAVVA